MIVFLQHRQNLSEEAFLGSFTAIHTKMSKRLKLQGLTTSTTTYLAWIEILISTKNRLRYDAKYALAHSRIGTLDISYEPNASYVAVYKRNNFALSMFSHRSREVA